MTNVFQTSEKAKSIAEHMSIILEYQNTGLFDRERATDIYKKFNAEHPDYNLALNVTAVASNTLTKIDYLPNNTLIYNLKLQAEWALGKEYLKSFGITV